MKISVIITLKKEVLDPQGKVIHQALNEMNFQNINNLMMLSDLFQFTQEQLIQLKMKTSEFRIDYIYLPENLEVLSLVK